MPTSIFFVVSDSTSSTKIDITFDCWELLIFGWTDKINEILAQVRWWFLHHMCHFVNPYVPRGQKKHFCSQTAEEKLEFSTRRCRCHGSNARATEASPCLTESITRSPGSWRACPTTSGSNSWRKMRYCTWFLHVFASTFFTHVASCSATVFSQSCVWSAVIVWRR